jgi:hypothetical protein
MQRMLDDPNYRFVFGKLNVGEHGWEYNTELIEFPKPRPRFVSLGLLNYWFKCMVIAGRRRS